MRDYVLSKMPSAHQRRLPTAKRLYEWLSTNGGAVRRMSWDPEDACFRHYYRGWEIITSHICVLFTHDGVLLSFTAREQEDLLGFPLGTGAGEACCLSSRRVHYYDATFGRCEGAMLFVSDLPMKTIVCLDGTPLTDYTKA